MKINSTVPSPVTLPNTRNPAATNTTAAAAPAPDQSSSSVTLQQTQAAAATIAPFDSRRVDEIRAAIAEGHFTIDAEKIADRLINGVREFLAQERTSA